MAKSEIGAGKMVGSGLETIESGGQVVDIAPDAGIAQISVELEHDWRGSGGHLGKAGSDHQRLDPASKRANARSESASLVMRHLVKALGCE